MHCRNVVLVVFGQVPTCVGGLHPTKARTCNVDKAHAVKSSNGCWVVCRLLGISRALSQLVLTGIALLLLLPGSGVGFASQRRVQTHKVKMEGSPYQTSLRRPIRLAPFCTPSKTLTLPYLTF